MGDLTRRTLAVLVATLGALALAGPAAGAALDPATELRTFSKTTERFRFITGTPAYQALLRVKGVERELQAAQILARDPDRVFVGQLCWQKMDGCSGDVRTYDWVTRGAGIALPVAWTARNGATISGHVWATARGPARRPGVVITTGSVQAPEELYWASAQALAKAGYVVLTWDVQGQGLSDTFGQGADRLDGVPSQEGRPFYDGTEDALDFFLSSAGRPFVPRRSCTSGTDHAARQRARVAAGLASAHNPLRGLLDGRRVGLAGQSLGASAVSYVGQLDPRVKAIVAWDDLRVPTDGPACASGASPRPASVPITKPALGVSNDYGLLPQPNLQAPDPEGRLAASKAYTAAGVDAMEVVIRGGTHYETAFIPNPAFGGSLRGYDLAAWYSVAWFDRYLKGSRGALRRLLTDRWRADARSGEVDPAGDPNVFSAYHRSRVALTDDRGRAVGCEDLRAGCPSLRPDGGPAGYDVIDVVQRRESSASGPGADAARGWVQSTDPVGSARAPAAASGARPSGERR